MKDRVELPVARDRALEAVADVVGSHARVQVLERTEDGFDVLGRAKNSEAELQVALRVQGSGAVSYLDQEARPAAEGERDSAETLDAEWALLDDLAERVRAELSRAAVHADPDTTGAYVATVLGARAFAVEPGRAVEVTFGPTCLWLRAGEQAAQFAVDQLSEVEAVPTTTAGLMVDVATLEHCVAHSFVGTVLSIVARSSEEYPDGRQLLLHIGGSSTSLVNQELDALRTALQPAGLTLLSRSIIRRRPTGPKVSSTELVRKLSALAQLHHSGELTEREWVDAKAQLLGID